MMHFKETDYGFEWGAAKVTRLMADEKKGWVTLGITTPKQRYAIQVHVSKSGKVRVFNCASNKEMKLPN